MLGYGLCMSRASAACINFNSALYFYRCAESLPVTCCICFTGQTDAKLWSY